MTTVFINGNYYSDDSNPTTGMANGGHRTRFIPALADVVVVAGEVEADRVLAVAAKDAAAISEANAAASAAEAVTVIDGGIADIASMTSDLLNGPAFSGTSTTSNSISSGTKTFTTQTGKSWYAGMKLEAFNSTSNYMSGRVTAYNSGTGVLTIEVSSEPSDISGSGTYTSWVIGVVTAERVAGDMAFLWAIILG